MDQIGRRRDNHVVERSVLRPAGIAVSDADCDIGVALSLEPLNRLPCLLINDFDGVYTARQLCEHRGLVAEAGADFEDNVAGFEFK